VGVGHANLNVWGRLDTHSGCTPNEGRRSPKWGPEAAIES